MFKYLGIFILVCSFTWLDAKPAVRMGTRSGLRKNHLNSVLKSSSGADYKENQSVWLKEMEGFLHLLWPYFFLEFEGSYGWFDKGKVKATETFPIDVSEKIDEHFKYKSKGEEIYFSTATGFPLRLSRSLFIVPLGGYSWDIQEIKRTDPFPDPSLLHDISPFSSLYTRLDPSKNEMKQRWYGPFLGLQLLNIQKNRYFFLIRYNYHFLQAREKLHLIKEYLGVDETGKKLLDINLNVYRKSHLNTKGHELIYRWIYRLDPHWDFGFSLNYRLYHSGFQNSATTKIVNQDFTKKQQDAIKLYLESYAVLIEFNKRY